MEQRTLGRTGLRVSRVGLGCVTFGREVEREHSFRILDYAFEHGINLFDTAEAYVAGDDAARSSESILGEWIRSRGCRGDVVVQSKVSQAPTRTHALESLERSLNRLGLDSLDVYLLHSYGEYTQLEEFAGAMSEAQRSGCIHAYGCSNFSLAQMQLLVACCERHDFTLPGAIEPIYNLVHREDERNLFPFCIGHEIGITTYSPLGAGFLTGKYTRDAAADPAGSRFAVKPGHRRIYCTEHGFEVLDKLQAVAASSCVEMWRLALGWTLASADITSVLVGATRIEHVRNALDVLEHPISAELVSALSATKERRHAVE